MAEIFIVTEEIYTGCPTERLHDVMRKFALKHGVLWPGGQVPLVDKPVLKPRVNHGRWIVDCPNCTGAAFANEAERFMCRNCWNGTHGHQYLPAPFPKQRRTIEVILAKRPLEENRNWDGETIKKLQQENKDNGVS